MQCVATNLIGNASAQLTNFDFNSFANFNGSRFAAGTSGLYEICCGDTDNTIDISSYITTASVDLGFHNHKRLRYIYLGVDASGSLDIIITLDDVNIKTYRAILNKTGSQRIRIPINRDIFGRYLSLKIANVNSNDFSLIDIQAIITVRPSGIR